MKDSKGNFVFIVLSFGLSKTPFIKKKPENADMLRKLPQHDFKQIKQVQFLSVKVIHKNNSYLERGAENFRRNNSGNIRRAEKFQLQLLAMRNPYSIIQIMMKIWLLSFLQSSQLFHAAIKVLEDKKQEKLKNLLSDNCLFPKCKLKRNRQISVSERHKIIKENVQHLIVFTISSGRIYIYRWK
ncbi:unnamed protein product [Paramecium octaurelia]|uniref:Uncharacterized protein n=1 Tax=Paramecium octaurelia TaxID=43137 RepID=A0A8S1YLN7_PAROT|nr:unnamed protein product [Paramecium octaurelia]